MTYSGPGWLDVEPRHAPRTPLTFLERHAVFLEYVDPAGLVRLRGHVVLSPDSPRFGTPDAALQPRAERPAPARPHPRGRHRPCAGEPREGRGRRRRPRHGHRRRGHEGVRRPRAAGRLRGRPLRLHHLAGRQRAAGQRPGARLAHRRQGPRRARLRHGRRVRARAPRAPAASRGAHERAEHRPKVAEHPVAARQIARARAWGALVGFVLVFWLSRRAGLPFPESGGRALVGGLVLPPARLGAPSSPSGASSSRPRSPPPAGADAP